MADMSFQDAIRTAFSKYATFEGRARRAEYWWFALFTMLVRVILNAVDRPFIGGDMGMGRYGMHGPGTLVVLFSLAVLVPSLAVAARRLHDIGRTGWWLLIILIPVVGWIILIIFAVQRGDAGANAYGADPIAS
jgi:uncharacterized membrane protein YhaH (DUF805 family)